MTERARALCAACASSPKRRKSDVRGSTAFTQTGRPTPRSPAARRTQTFLNSSTQWGCTALSSGYRSGTPTRSSGNTRKTGCRITTPGTPACTGSLEAEFSKRNCLQSKSIFERLRRLTGASRDGAALVEASLSLGKTGTPALAINSLGTQTEKDEQSGLANLIKGLGGLYRNPTAHDPRLSRSISDEELLEVLTMVSIVHRRLDGANHP